MNILENSWLSGGRFYSYAPMECSNFYITPHCINAFWMP